MKDHPARVCSGASASCCRGDRRFQTYIFLVLLVAVVSALLLDGCASPTRLSAVPKDLTTTAVVPGIPGARYWMVDNLEPFIQDILVAMRREKEYLSRTGHRGPLPPINYLAISGGGDNGAFGAGLLVGWTEAGTRPKFNVVTGISTGALIAPFAFLGSAHDETLKTVYTTIGPRQIFEPRSRLAMLFDDALADSTPLWRLIERHVNAELLQKIKDEYQKGRFLLIGTTDLDARRPVIWNMGAIAERGDPQALDLFRKILLASAAIPALFPPVMIDVEADGKRHQEMHVDGGAVAQVFLFPGRLGDVARKRRLITQREKTAYIIRNSRLDPDWASVDRRALSILGRAITSLIQTQGIGDLYQIFLVGKEYGIDFNLAFIGRDFEAEHKEDFDTEYMRALFDYGYQLARKGYPWQKTPPGYTQSPGEQ